jgi:hypothetical protein
MRWGPPAPVFLQRVYTIGPLIFVPLYGDARYYIGPGFPLHNRIRYTSDELLKAGCRPQEHYLLARIGMTELNRGEL